MDMLFIGSGAATTTTLIELMEKLLHRPGKKLTITVIEKNDELWKGIPYGSRSSINALTITHTADFIYTEKEQPLFQSWLRQHHDRWIDYYRENGGLAARHWLAENLDNVKAGQWDKVYLPRFLFGLYAREKLVNLIERAREADLLELEIIHGEAIAVKKTESGFTITIQRTDKGTIDIESEKVVLAIGSAPVKRHAANDHRCIDELYQPSAEENIAAILEKLRSTANQADKNVLIIGSNASSIELMYLLSHRPDILAEINQLVVLSRAGRMPYHLSEEEQSDYPAHHLDQVKSGSYDVHQLVIAMKKDLADAIDDTVVVPHINRIIGYALQLLEPLGQQAKEIFFSVYGPHITSIIRRSGPAYKGAAEQLLANGKMHLLKGEFVSLIHEHNGARLLYIGQQEKQTTYPVRFQAVVNCTGSDSLKNTSSLLLRSLLQSGICRTTFSGEGILVNDRFEASDDFYVMGPLLAGNMNQVIHFWHLENVSRLLYLAPFLADELLR
jgi:uncharacterized NAD(P)/FAD-binding protein YdhS